MESAENVKIIDGYQDKTVDLRYRLLSAVSLSRA
jgi:hypothetical protein